MNCWHYNIYYRRLICCQILLLRCKSPHTRWGESIRQKHEHQERADHEGRKALEFVHHKQRGIHGRSEAGFPRASNAAGKCSGNQRAPFSLFSLSLPSLLSLFLSAPSPSADPIFMPLCLRTKEGYPSLHMTYGLHSD